MLMKVAVVGLGYVGTVTAACLASQGRDVWGIDVDAAKVDDVCRGRSPVAEPGLDALVEQAVAGGTLHASTSHLSALDGADVSLGRRRPHAAPRTCSTYGEPWTTSSRQ